MHVSSSSSGRVVVGVDGSTGSLAALDFAFDEAARRGAGLLVVSAFELPEVWSRPACYTRPAQSPWSARRPIRTTLGLLSCPALPPRSCDADASRGEAGGHPVDFSTRHWRRAGKCGDGP